MGSFIPYASMRLKIPVRLIWVAERHPTILGIGVYSHTICSESYGAVKRVRRALTTVWRDQKEPYSHHEMAIWLHGYLEMAIRRSGYMAITKWLSRPAC